MVRKAICRLEAQPPAPDLDELLMSLACVIRGGVLDSMWLVWCVPDVRVRVKRDRDELPQTSYTALYEISSYSSKQTSWSTCLGKVSISYPAIRKLSTKTFHTLSLFKRNDYNELTRKTLTWGKWKCILVCLNDTIFTYLKIQCIFEN